VEGGEVMARTGLLAIVALVVGVAATGCSNVVGPDCTDVAVPGLAIDVREAGSAVPLRRDVTITVTADGFQESMTFTANTPTIPWSTAYERPGTYTITVRRPGYREWSRSGVVVEREDHCHVRPTSVTAELEPANEARFTFSGAASGTFESRGVPRLPTDYTRDFALLGVGRVNTTDVTHQLLAVNTGSAYFAGGFDDFLFYLNPRITQAGTYAPGACPEPADFGGCIHGDVRFGVPAGGGGSQILLTPVASAVTITVVEITPDRLRATFEGTFNMSRPGQAPTQVAVSGGSIDITRTYAP
jgi:hypothetical protein